MKLSRLQAILVFMIDPEIRSMSLNVELDPQIGVMQMK